MIFAAKVLEPVTECDIPDTLKDRLQEEKKQEALRRKERTEAHLYMNIHVVLEDHFANHQGNDLFDPEKVPYRNFRIKKTATLMEFMEMLSETLVSDVSCSAHLCRNFGINYRISR
jgi:ubiquitin carboxyl-terminal hydrolase 7